MGDSVISINLRFHHRGKFLRDPDLRYTDEELAELWLPDRDKLHYMKIKRYVRSFGYSQKPQIYWLKLGHKLDDGLYLLSDDRMTFQIFKYCEHLESVDFYLNHGVDDTKEVLLLEGITIDIDDLFETNTDCVDNNMCKAFNGSILEARTMHIQ